MFFEWDDGFRIGIAEIDRQHHGLVDTVNTLYDAMSVGKGMDVIVLTLNKLVEYTVIHFRTEEDYFDRFGYPEAEAHKKEHADFRKRVSDFNDGYAKGQVALTVSVLKFLSAWLTYHIKGTDMKYGPFLIMNGLS